MGNNQVKKEIEKLENQQNEMKENRKKLKKRKKQRVLLSFEQIKENRKK